MLRIETLEPSLEDLADEIASLAAHISATTCRWLGLIAQFDERMGWALEGASTCSAWVSWRCGVSLVTAREHVRVARALRVLPLVRAAFAAGLSYSKVRALTRIDRIRDEAELVDLARHADAAQLDRIVAAFRGVTTERADRIHAARCLDVIDEGDGSVTIRGRLPSELGAILVAAVRAAEERLEAPDPSAAGADATVVPATARRADALVLLAQSALTGQTGGSPVEVLVHVDAASLTARDDHDHDRDAAGAGDCRIGDDLPVAAETVRRLCCDAGIVPVVHGDQGELLSVGRRTRAIPPSIRRALTVRDGGCRFPGCGRTRWLQAHHVEHWAHGGETSLSNLVLLCHHHHQLIHEGGWELIASGDGTAFDAVAPAGHHVTPVPALPRERPAPESIGGAGSLLPLSAGQPWDLGMAVEALLDWTDRPDLSGGAP